MAAITAAGALAGVLHVQGSSLAQALTGATVGAALATALVLLAVETTRWDHLLSAVAVIVFAALCHKYGGLAREEPTGERLMLLKANVVVGWLLYMGRLGVEAWAQGPDPQEANAA
jgi:hypothetical protein